MNSKIFSGVNRSQRFLAVFKLRHVSNSSVDINATIPNPKKTNTDMIGPADPVSNLRKIIFKQPIDETKLEKKYRKMRSEVQEWNQRFWTQHNSSFFQEREEYLRKTLPPGKQSLTADEMSVFYKSFLDKNWKNHVDYNIEWYKKNIHLLYLAIQVEFTRVFKLKDKK